MIQSNQHYGFFYSDSNDIFHSIQFVALLSSTSSCSYKHDGKIKGAGTYMYLDNFRRSISLFSTRSLVKSDWINSNNVYIGEPK